MDKFENRWKLLSNWKFWNIEIDGNWKVDMFEALGNMRLHLKLLMHSTFMSKTKFKKIRQMSITIMYCPFAHVTTSLPFWIMFHSLHGTRVDSLSTTC
jgi:hypothetical protein